MRIQLNANSTLDRVRAGKVDEEYIDQPWKASCGSSQLGSLRKYVYPYLTCFALLKVPLDHYPYKVGVATFTLSMLL